MNPREYIYCPFCSSSLDIIVREGKDLKHCNNCKWTHYPTPHIAVAGVTIRYRADNRPYVLMVKRKREPFKDTWMFPAGFLEFGECPEEDTLLRELREETGLTVVKSNFITILKSENDPRSPEHLVIFYQIELMGNIVNNDKEENSEIEWKSIYEDIDIGFPHHKKIFDKICQSIRMANNKSAD